MSNVSSEASYWCNRRGTSEIAAKAGAGLLRAQVQKSLYPIQGRDLMVNDYESTLISDKPKGTSLM